MQFCLLKDSFLWPSCSGHLLVWSLGERVLKRRLFPSITINLHLWVFPTHLSTPWFIEAELLFMETSGVGPSPRKIKTLREQKRESACGLGAYRNYIPRRISPDNKRHHHHLRSGSMNKGKSYMWNHKVSFLRNGMKQFTDRHRLIINTSWDASIINQWVRC